MTQVENNQIFILHYHTNKSQQSTHSVTAVEEHSACTAKSLFHYSTILYDTVR